MKTRNDPLSFCELLVLRCLQEAYPEHVAPERLHVGMVKSRRVVVGELGRPGTTQICSLRQKGYDIETVYPMCHNRKGRLVRVPNAHCLGYRLASMPEVTSSSETHVPVVDQETTTERTEAPRRARIGLRQETIHAAMGRCPDGDL